MRAPLLASCVILASVAVGACIIANPPPELPRLPPLRPTIVHGAVTPPPTRVLARMPTEFLVPVELLDPSRTFEWRVFVDYDPLVNSQAIFAGTSDPVPTRPEERVRVIPFGDPLASADLALQTCHVIELVVAYGFPGTSLHTPDERGGDVVVWMYNPAGDLKGCPIYDAGAFADAAPPSEDDAGADR